MKFLHRTKKWQNLKKLCESDYYVLNYEQLLLVNGAGSTPSTSSTSTSPSTPSNSGNLTNKGYPSSTDYNPGICSSGTLSDRGYPSSTTGYNPNAPTLNQDIKIYAIDYPSSNDGEPDHFVNDIGNGKYYDPWTGETGNVSDLNLSTEGLGGTRILEYHK